MSEPPERSNNPAPLVPAKLHPALESLHALNNALAALLANVDFLRGFIERSLPPAEDPPTIAARAQLLEALTDIDIAASRTRVHREALRRLIEQTVHALEQP